MSQVEPLWKTGVTPCCSEERVQCVLPPFLSCASPGPGPGSPSDLRRDSARVRGKGEAQGRKTVAGKSKGQNLVLPP